MTIKSSTGLRNHIAGTGSLRGLLHGACEIRIYSGTVPASADDATGSAVLLVTIRKNGTDPLGFETGVTDGTLAKAVGELWNGNAVATGVATFYRLVLTADDNGASTTAPRQQGTVGLAGTDLTLTNVNITNGAPQSIEHGVVMIPV